MKKLLILLLFLVVSFANGYAQQKIKIQLKNGTTLTYNVSEIDSIQFEYVSQDTDPTTDPTPDPNPDPTPEDPSNDTHVDLPVITPEIAPTYTPDENMPVAQYVDLGLSVKWATWNMGATSEDDYGAYIAWGDPTGNNTSYTNTDYPNDLKCICGTKYDVASVKWGTGWRLPTYEELEELASLPKTLVTRNGVTGFLISGKGDKSGNTLFLPRSGYNNVDGLQKEGERAYYWSGVNYTMDYALGGTIGYYSADLHHYDKALHLAIRPVYDSSDSDTPNEETPGDDNPDETDDGKTMSAVDLGLSVKWASCNLGASSSTDNGTYFAWGETEAKDTYDINNYKFYDTTTQLFSDMGTSIKNTDKDAAHVLLGGKWRMPSSDEFDELLAYCTWSWTGSGYKVKGPNGKSIYLPAAGMYSGSELVYNGTQGKYWSSDHDETPLHGEDHWGASLVFSANGPYVYGNYQYNGLPIRPVCE